MPDNSLSGPNDCVCEECKLRTPFTLPEHLFSELRAGNVVIFAGAGISTEGARTLPKTLYAEICESLGEDPEKAGAFPEVMTRFVAQPNGRRLLLRKIRDRLAYVDGFAEIRRHATRFHRELSTIHHAEIIVTTNWDDYFERECGATPFITAEDFAFWDVPGRRVFKLHGSVQSYGSIVATRSDYDACFERLKAGLIGSNLRMMLATKTVLYVGFSFRDDDFVRLHDMLSAEMGGLRPQSYIVTLDRGSDQRFKEHNLIPIYTEAAYFLECVKSRLVAETDMFPDDIYSGIVDILDDVNATHLETSALVDLQKYPEAIYTLFYQDGLHHALERILTLRKSGYYSHACNPRNVISTYEKLRKEALKAGNYPRVAYIEGYLNGHMAFVLPEDGRKHLPKYFVFGYEPAIRSLSGLKRALKQAPTLHKRASALARKAVRYSMGRAHAVVHHPPWF